MLPQLINKKKSGSVLFLASFSGCPRVWKMASTLAEKNYEVTILEWDRSSKLPANQRIKGINVNRMKLSAPYGSKLIAMFPIWCFYVSFFILANNFDVIQPQNLDNLLISWVASHLKRMKIVYDIADF